MKNFIKEKWIFLLIVIQPVLDIIAFFQYDSPLGTLAGYLRLAIMLMVPLYVLIKYRKPSFVILMGIIAAYCAAHMAVCYFEGYKNMTEDISYMLKVIQAPILGISLCYVVTEEKHQKQIISGFFVNFITIVLTSLIAHLSDTGLYTYNTYKIGFLGWFANANSQSIILITLCAFVLYYILKTDNLWAIIPSMLGVSLLSILNATRACYYGMIIIFVALAGYYIIELLLQKNKTVLKNLGLAAFSVAIVIVSFLSYPLTPRYAMDTLIASVRNKDNLSIESELKNFEQEVLPADTYDKYNSQKNELSSEMKTKLIEIYTPLMNKDMVDRFGAERVLEKYGWQPNAYALADVRLQKTINAQLIWEDSSTLKHFFGFEFTEVADYDLENDYPALYYYYGYIGISLYLIFIGYFVFLIIKAIFTNFKGTFNLFNYMLLIAFGLEIGLAQFSGAILRRPNASIYLAFVVALVFYACKKAANKSKVTL